MAWKSQNTVAPISKIGWRGQKGQEVRVDYITRKDIFNHLWMGIGLARWHHDQLWQRYPVLQKIELCIRQFREIVNNKYAAALLIH